MAPKPEQLKEALRYLDLGIKFEMLLYDLSSNLYWGSIAEVLAFLFNLLLFTTDPTEMAPIWFLSCHLVRGIVGILVIVKIPASHKLVKSMENLQGNKSVAFKDLKLHVTKAAYDCANEFGKGAGPLLLVYLILTILCIILDLFGFFFGVSYFDGEVSAYPAVSLIILSSASLFLCLYYIIWIIGSKMKFPVYV